MEKTITELLTDAATIKNETAENANTASRVGSMVENIVDSFNPYRGDYAGTNSFPTTGGRYTAGVPAIGDRWRLTNELTIGGTDIYAAGTIIEAATNAPGQTTANWIKYAVQV